MAEAAFDHGYAGGAFQYTDYQSMSNMQRFLKQEGPYLAARPMFDHHAPQFTGKDQSPITPGLYETPNPWPHNVNTTQEQCPQETWSSEWASPDQESCPGATRTPWSPQATESCSDHDPRYSPWVNTAVPHPYSDGYGYTTYGSSLPHGPAGSSSQSFTGTLSEIQQYPDTDHDDRSSKGEMHVSDRGYPGVTVRLDAGTPSFHRDEGLGSSVNESAIASPSPDGDDAAMDSVNGDGGHDSDYSPQSRSTRALKNRKPRVKASNSPIAKRPSLTKGNPHQLTNPAKITKRTSSTSKPAMPINLSASQHPSHPSQNSAFPCPNCPTAFASAATLSKHVLSVHTRPFTCSFRRYGCPATFGSKNEWKRHVSSQHLCLEIWRCDIGECVPRPVPRRSSTNSSHTSNQNGNRQSAGYSHNDFNRKDLFMSHIRRMHKPPHTAPRADKDRFNNSLEDIARRCNIPLRESPPKSICGYCAPHPSQDPPSSVENGNKRKGKEMVFDGKGTWDERMEHVGRHLEKDGDPGFEEEDLELRDWMIKEKLLERTKEGWKVIGLGARRRRVDARKDVMGSEGEEEEVDAEGEDDEDADGEDE
ncbi:MAG: hypothetical protein Q9181_002567 [Wetmoreana brouardii]